VAAGDAVEGLDPDGGEEVLEEMDGAQNPTEEGVEGGGEDEGWVLRGGGFLLGGGGIGHGGKVAQPEAGGKRFVRKFDSR